MITPKDLIKMGFKPGKWIPEAVNYINENKLEGEALNLYLEPYKPKPIIDLHEAPVEFQVNIKAEAEVEEGNVDKVVGTMDVLMKTPTVVDGAVMPDACPSGPEGTIPVGGVVATKNAIHPGMHSADF